MRMLTFLNSNIALYNQLPEIFLAFVILSQLLLNLNLKNSEISKHYYLNFYLLIQSFFILIFTLLLLLNCNYTSTNLNFLFLNTVGTNLLKEIIIFFSVLVLFPVAQGFYLQKLNFFEFYIVYLLAVLASLLLVSCGDFLSAYLLIEIQSLCFYILATFRKNSIFSVEAGIKYFIFGSLVSCILLFSLSLLYAVVGTLNFHALNLLFYSFPFSNSLNSTSILVLFSLCLLCTVFFFKIGIAPFHFWVPDVYEGAPTSATIIFSVLPKLVLFDLFIKISRIFGNAFYELEILFIFLGLLSVSVGALFAMAQGRVKRFFIYSSISQMGFPLLLLTVNNSFSSGFIYFFLFIYLFSSILSWTIYLFMYQFSEKFYKSDEKSISSPLYLTDLSNIFLFDKPWAIFFLLSLFSLAGIPPLAGFLSKFFIAFELILNKYNGVSILLVFFASVSTFYYVRIIKIMFFEPAGVKKARFNFFFDKFDFLLISNIVVAVLCLLTIFYAFFIIEAWLVLSQYLYFNNFF